ncbi:MAG: NAD-dependent epimerase/dehydratase family protein [Actinobacteria bacterium]|nr:NAD-dependent epimerase/dehydratase family protein [Actinomycetota bacterium]
MKILVLGGGTFVGRALVESATSRGHEVTTFTRKSLPPGATEGLVESLFGDRTEENAMQFAKGRQWDAIFDTWSGAPRVMQQNLAVLRDHASYFSYVSSCSVYSADPPTFGQNESSPVVDADASAERTHYAADKRGGELAVLESFGEEASLLARPGIILGPYEGPGRLPWWLRRIAKGGDVIAPGPQDLKIQYIDARDLAEWMIASAEKSLTGAFNTISTPGHATTSQLLKTCLEVTKSDANLVWMSPEFLAEQGIEQWNELPIWADPSFQGIFGFDTSLAANSGLICRPISETVADTWKWLQSYSDENSPSFPASIGLPHEKELAALEALRKPQ